MLEHIPHLISDEENKDLLSLIEEDEVRKVIWSLNLHKSLGSYGFPISFYHNFWDIIKKDLCIMLQYAQKSYKLGGSTNSSFLDMISKEVNPYSFS
jgi:hypothetical protein